jgi:hypothetical protein
MHMYNTPCLHLNCKHEFRMAVSDRGLRFPFSHQPNIIADVVLTATLASSLVLPEAIAPVKTSDSVNLILETLIHTRWRQLKPMLGPRKPRQSNVPYGTAAPDLWLIGEPNDIIKASRRDTDQPCIQRWPGNHCMSS